jgi:hypothetical protein
VAVLALFTPVVVVAAPLTPVVAAAVEDAAADAVEDATEVVVADSAGRPASVAPRARAVRS